MTEREWKKNAASIIAAALVAMLAIARAQAGESSYPTKPVRMVIPFPAGGTTDILGRVAAQKLSEGLGQQVVPDNRPGASGNIGTEQVAKAAPDGYMLLTAPGSTLTIHPSLYPKLGFDPLKDFAPVTILAGVPNLLVVHPSLPARNVKELIALAKSKPDALNYASTGAGQSTHLSMELFKSMAGVKIVHVPYKGSAPAVTDLLGGHVPMMFDNMPSALPHVKAGKLRPLGVSTVKRSSTAPEVPTVAESGLPGFDVTVWFAVLAPAATPRDIVDRLHRILVKGLQAADVRERLATQGAEPVGNTPEQFTAQMKTDLAKWAKVVKAANIKLD
jgi:tripartite-type tricarboxylate transporter receptor subunit TctC